MLTVLRVPPDLAMLLALRPDQFTRMLWRIVLVLTGAHVVGQVSRWGFGRDSVFGLVPLFDLNDEVNVPTFYATLSLALCAGLMALSARVQFKLHKPFSLHWAGLSIIMLFLSLDEFASLHERLSDPVRSSLDLGGVLTSAWVLPYGVAALLLGLTYLSFLRALPKPTRSLLLLGGATFVLGAIGMEMVAGPAKEAAAGSASLAITVFTTIEEVLEMAGVVICIHGLTTHLVSETGHLDLRLGELGEDDESMDEQTGRVPATRRTTPIMGGLFRSRDRSTR